MSKLKVYIDGASSGNPGYSGIGIVIKKNGKTILTISRCVGIKTNNQAEYLALIESVKWLLKNQKNADVLVLSDSQLLVRQVKGEYRVKSDSIKPLHDTVRKLLEKLRDWEIRHIPREENKEADKLAKAGVRVCQKSSKSQK